MAAANVEAVEKEIERLETEIEETRNDDSELMLVPYARNLLQLAHYYLVVHQEYEFDPGKNDLAEKTFEKLERVVEGLKNGLTGAFLGQPELKQKSEQILTYFERVRFTPGKAPRSAAAAEASPVRPEEGAASRDQTTAAQDARRAAMQRAAMSAASPAQSAKFSPRSLAVKSLLHFKENPVVFSAAPRRLDFDSGVTTAGQSWTDSAYDGGINFEAFPDPGLPDEVFGTEYPTTTFPGAPFAHVIL